MALEIAFYMPSFTTFRVNYNTGNIPFTKSYLGIFIPGEPEKEVGLQPRIVNMYCALSTATGLSMFEKEVQHSILTDVIQCTELLFV